MYNVTHQIMQTTMTIIITRIITKMITSMGTSIKARFSGVDISAGKEKKINKGFKYKNNVFLTNCITDWTISICLLLQ